MKKPFLIFAGAVIALSISAWARAPRLKDTIETVRLGDFDPVELGSGTFRLKNIFASELAVKEFSVMLYPKNGTAGVLYKRTPVKERLLLDRAARSAVISAYELYLKDYEEKKLDRNQRKFKESYGYARAKIEWGPFQYSTYADPKISMGYIFVGKSPYFCIRIPSTKSPQNKGDVPVEYGGLLLYFTRAQAKDLADSISDEEIQEAISAQVLHDVPEDSYDDAESGRELGGSEKEQPADYEEAD